MELLFSNNVHVLTADAFSIITI